MADELSIVVKTVLEVDEAESKRRINEARDKILKSGYEIKLTADIKRQEFQKNLKDAIASAEKSVAKTPFKFGADIKRQEFQQNLKDAIKSAQKVIANSVKVSIGVDESASLKQIDKYIEEAKKKLNNAKLDLNINSNLVSNESKANKNGKKTKPASWKSNPQNIEGGKRYREALEDTIKANEHIFKDKNMKRSSVSYFISPNDDQVKAIVEYSDGLGKTASMMLTAKKAAKGSEKVLEGIQVKQLKVVDNQEKYNKALAQQTKEAERQKAIQQKAQQKADEKYSKKEESSANWLSQQENAFKNLYSKAFNQKNPLTDGFRAEAEEALVEYASALDELKKAGGIFTGDQKRNIADLREYAKRAIDEQRSSQYGQADLGAKDVSSQRKIREIEIGDEIKKLKDLGLYTGEIEKSFRGLNDEISKIDDFKALQDWQDRFRVARLEADKLLESVQGLAAKQAIGIEGKQIPQIDSYLSNESIKDGKTDGIVALRDALEKLKQAYVELQQKFKQDNLDENQYAALQVELKGLDTQLRKTANSAKMFDGSMKSNEVLERLNAAKSKLKTDFEKMKFDWSKALEIPELKRQIDEMERALESVDEVNLRNVQNQFKQLQANIRLAKADTKSFGTQIKDLFVKFQQYFSVADIIRETTQAIGKMSENVKVLNSAMTELKKVTDLTEQEYDEFVSSSADRAIDIGTGLSDYVEGVADFAKLGESMTNAIEKSEAANILYKVGDGFNSIEDSTDVVITSLKAYKKEALSATNVIDKLNEVSNKTSITTAGLSDALTRSASALALSGLSMDKSIALAVAGNETTRNASMTGNALKTLSLRIRGATSDLEEAGEEVDDYVKSTSKMREEIKGLTGVDIMIDNATFKDLYDIMDELSNVYDTLEDIEKANLTEILFGKLRANVGASILQNFDQAEKALQVAQNSAGSAAKEHDRWMQSIAASEAKAEAAFEQFSNKVLSSDLIKMGYDAQTGILGFLSNIIDLSGSAIPLITTLASGILSLTNNIGISKVNMPCLTWYGVAA